MHDASLITGLKVKLYTIGNPGTIKSTMDIPNFKPIPGYLGYRISDSGRVQSCWKFRGVARGIPGVWAMSNDWRDMRPETSPKGYLRARLRYDAGKYRKLFVHDLVLLTFVGPRPKPRMHGCHENGKNTDNRASNLRWGTAWSNNQDRIKHGTICRGETHPLRKLTDANVVEIRQRFCNDEPATKIGRDFGVSGANVACIGYGSTWTHVGGPRKARI